mgnify:CR=1 FL=1
MFKFELEQLMQFKVGDKLGISGKIVCRSECLNSSNDYVILHIDKNGVPERTWVSEENLVELK